MGSWLGLPEVASAHGAALDEINVLVHWLMLVLFIGWAAFFLWLLVRFRRGRNPAADYRGIQTKAPKWMEGGVAAVEAVLLLAFSIPLWSERVDAFPAEEESTVVRVVGQQFAWNVHYPGPDGVFGATRVELVNEETNPLGLDASDPAGADDVTSINNLYLPVDRPAIVHLSSKDVIHGFMLNEMRVKQDAIPGQVIPIWFEVTRSGHYQLLCAELCGWGHYKMKARVVAEPLSHYQQYLEDLQKDQNDDGVADAPSQDEDE